MTGLCTNLPRTPFSLDLVARPYRFRWQIGIAAAFRDGMAFLLANARRSNPRRDRKTGRLRTRLVVVGERL